MRPFNYQQITDYDLWLDRNVEFDGGVIDSYAYFQDLDKDQIRDNVSSRLKLETDRILDRFKHQVIYGQVQGDYNEAPERLAVFTLEAIIHLQDPKQDLTAVEEFIAFQEECTWLPDANWVELRKPNKNAPKNLDELKEIVEVIESRISGIVELVAYQRQPDLLRRFDLPQQHLDDLAADYFKDIEVTDDLSSYISSHGGKDTITAIIDTGFFIDRLRERTAGIYEDLSGHIEGSLQAPIVQLGTGTFTPRIQHGTQTAIVIGAQWASDVRARGLAPLSKLALISISGELLISPTHLARALTLATGRHHGTQTRGCDIVSTGLPFEIEGSIPSLEKVFSLCETQKRGQGGALLCFSSPYASHKLRSDYPWLNQDSIMLVGNWILDNISMQPMRDEGLQGIDLLAPDRSIPGVALSSTSASAPVVAGAAALLAGKFKDLTPADLRTALKVSARRMPGQTGKRPHLDHGWGRLSIQRAMRVAECIQNKTDEP